MPSLMSLPTEVRMIIWEAILPEEVIFQALREEEPSKLPPNPVLSLLLVFSGWEMTKSQGTWFYPDIATGSVKFKVSEPEE